MYNSLIQFSGKHIAKERIVSFEIKRHKVFPYIVFKRPFAYYFIWKYPFHKRWLFDGKNIINWITRYCIVMELDNGKIIRQWYYDEGPSGYGSSTNAERAFSELRVQYLK